MAEKMERFDLVVIGSGTAAGEIASTCAKAGKSVAIIDSKPFGGTCALRGCDPKKVLVGAADVVDWARRMAPNGVSGDARIDWPALMKFKRTFTDPVPPSKEKSFAEQGIAAIHGRAQFIAEDRLTVDGREIVALNFALAAGMRPQPLGIPGEGLLIDSEQFLNLDYLPSRIVFVGGGYIAFEFAHLAVRAGSQVTILNGSRPLGAFDPDLVERLVQKSRDIGINMEIGSKVSAIEKTPDGFSVRAGETSYVADLVVHAAGRVPDVADMGLENAHVLHSPKGISVNEFLQSTSNPRVFAAGDCADTGNPALTPVAGFEARLAAANILNAKSAPLTPHVIPSVVFTIPPMARVGKSESELKTAGTECECVLQQTGGWYSSRRVAEETGATKVLIAKGTGKILGAHLLGHGSEELINVFALAIRAGMTAEDLKDQIFSYPTHGSDIRYMV